MVFKVDVLDVVVVLIVQKDMVIMIEDEKVLREIVCKLGVIDLERMDFELLLDDECQCVKCKIICFMFVIFCFCKFGLFVCLYYVKELCFCLFYKYKLWYRYMLDDFYFMMNVLKF